MSRARHDPGADRPPGGFEHAEWMAGGRGSLAKPGIASADDGLGPVRDLKFGEDVADVIGDGFRAQTQITGDGRVRAALGDQLENFAFTLG